MKTLIPLILVVPLLFLTTASAETGTLELTNKLFDSYVSSRALALSGDVDALVNSMPEEKQQAFKLLDKEKKEKVINLTIFQAEMMEKPEKIKHIHTEIVDDKARYYYYSDEKDEFGLSLDVGYLEFHKQNNAWNFRKHRTTILEKTDNDIGEDKELAIKKIKDDKDFHFGNYPN